MATRLARSLATSIAFVFAFVINPAYVAGCGASVANEDDPEDNAKMEAELLQMLDDLNGQGAWQFEHEGDSYEILLELTQQKKPASAATAHRASPFIAAAHACGTRTFYQSASACITIYELAVEGTFSLRRLGAKPETIASDVPLRGTVQNFGEAYLTFGTGGDLQLHRANEGSFELDRFMTDNLGKENLALEFSRI